MLEKWRYTLRLRQSVCNLQVHLGSLITIPEPVFCKGLLTWGTCSQPSKEEGFVRKVTLTEIPFAKALFMADGSSTRIELMSESSHQIWKERPTHPYRIPNKHIWSWRQCPQKENQIKQKHWKLFELLSILQDGSTCLSHSMFPLIKIWIFQIKKQNGPFYSKETVSKYESVGGTTVDGRIPANQLLW